MATASRKPTTLAETPPQFPFRPQPIDMTPTRATAEPCMDHNNLTNQLTTILCESFGIEPKGQGHIYQKTYPDYYDQLPYPRVYRIPEFSKFSGEDGKTTLEHVRWFTSLASNSIFTWAQLEQKFHEYFYSGDTELRLSHLTTIKQKHNEPTIDYIRRFRDTINRCFI
jgi:hypothetical protein